MKKINAKRMKMTYNQFEEKYLPSISKEREKAEFFKHNEYFEILGREAVKEVFATLKK